MMEFKILVPKINEYQITWNNQELKEALTAKMEEYNTIVYTADNVKEAKQDKAQLNNLRTAIEDKRKEIKAQCMKPYQTFEKEVKELISLIDEPIGKISEVINEIEEKRIAEKLAEVQGVFFGMEFPDFVTLDRIADKKWMNATCTMKKIGDEMAAIKLRIETDMKALDSFGEYAFEAMEEYKNTLDLSAAIRKTQELSELAKKKKENEQRQEETAKAFPDETIEEIADKDSGMKNTDDLFCLSLTIEATTQQLAQLRDFLETNNIQYSMV